jgi:cell division protein FtsQ
MLKQFYNSVMSLTVYLLSVIVICTLSFNWSNFKKIYDIDEINIYGTNFFDQSIIEEKSDVLKSYNIFDRELGNYKDEMLKFDHIIDFKISRKFPSTIDITIYEREPIALISSDELIILDSEGVCLPVEYCDLSLPILSNFKSNPELYPKGSKTASTNVLSSVNLMKYTKDNYSIIYDNISEFVFNEDSEYEIILKNGRTRIFLGSQNLQLKIKYLESFQETLKEEKNITDFRYIDLRFNNQVIVKEA